MYVKVIIGILVAAAGGLIVLLALAFARRRQDYSRRTLRKYLDAVATKYEYLDMLDLRRQIRLEDIYVTLKMARKVQKPEMPGMEDGRQDDMPLQIWRDRGQRRIIEQLEDVELEDVLKEKCLVFRGDPGAGKSTLLKHLAYTHSTPGEGKRPIPVFVMLAELMEEFDGDLDEWLNRYYRKQADLLREKLENGECMVPLDGLDEVKQDKWESIKSRARTFADWDNQVIVTCRGVAYFNGAMPPQFQVYEVVGFSEEQQRQFLNKWFQEEEGKADRLFEALKSNHRMLELTQNPLLLSLTAVVCENDPEFQLPVQRLELYERAVEFLIKRRRTRGKGTDFDAGDKRAFLGEVALQYFTEGREIFCEQDLLDRIRTWQREKQVFIEGTRAKLLEELTVHNGLLVRHADNRYRFLHLTFQEYFTAYAIRNSGNWRKYVKEKYAWYPRWEEVIYLLGSLMEDASELISLIWTPDVEDDIFNNRLLLAGWCLGSAQVTENIWKDIAHRVDRIYDQTEYDLCRDIAVYVYSLMAQTHPEVLDRFCIDLKNADHSVRRKAAQTLGLIGSDSSVKPLVAALRDKEFDVRNRVAQALGRIGSEEAVKPLTDALQDDDSDVRSSAAYALGRIGCVESVRPLTDALRDENNIVRQSAAQALGWIGSKEAVKALIFALRDENDFVRHEVAYALGEISGEYTTKMLISTLKNEGPTIRASAVSALGWIGTEDTVRLLIDTLKDEEPNVRSRAADALGLIGDESAVDSLLNALKDEDPLVRRRAAHALGQIGSRDAVKPLVNMLNDRNHDVRRTVANALGQIGSEDATEPLIDVVKNKDESSIVRWMAAAALGSTGGEGVAELLIDALEEQNRQVRRGVIMGLGRIGTKGVVKPLANMLKNGDPRIREEAVDALGRISSVDSVKPLIDMLRDSEPDVRRKAAHALGQIRNEDAVRPLMNVIKDMNEDLAVRNKAANALYKISNPPGRAIFHDGVRRF